MEPKSIQYEFLEDKPIESLGDDWFKVHTAKANTIEDIVRNCPTPFTIGILGSWGTGKTGILSILKEKLRGKADGNESNYPLIILDVWKFSTDPLRRWVLTELRQQLKAINQEYESVFENYKYDDKTLEQNLFASTTSGKSSNEANWKKLAFELFISVLVLGIIYILLSFVFVFLTDNLVETIQLDKTLGQQVSQKGIQSFANSSLLLIVFIAFLLSFIKSVINFYPNFYLTQRTNSTQSGPTFSAEQFAKIFGDIVKQATDKCGAKKLIICFDNLDRVEASAAIEVLSTIKTFLEIPKCIYLIPCDEDALVKHISQDLDSNSKEYAQEYLAKCFQLSLRLPPLNSFDLEDFLDNQLIEAKLQDDVKSTARELILFAYPEATPRQIKRAVNSLTAYLLLVEELESSILDSKKLTGNKNFLLKFILLHIKWPKFVEKLEKAPELWEETYDHVNETEDYSKVEPEENRSLYQFLRKTINIQCPENIEDYITLKAVVDSGGKNKKEIQSELESGSIKTLRDRLTNDKKNDASKLILYCTNRLIDSGKIHAATSSLTVLSQIWEEMHDKNQARNLTEKLIICLIVDSKSPAEETLELQKANLKKINNFIPQMSEPSKDRLAKWCQIAIGRFVEIDKNKHELLLKEMLDWTDHFTDEQRINISIPLAVPDENNPSDSHIVLTQKINKFGKLKPLCSTGLISEYKDYFLQRISNSLDEDYFDCLDTILSTDSDHLAFFRDLFARTKTLPPDQTALNALKCLSRTKVTDEDLKNEIVDSSISIVGANDLGIVKPFVFVLNSYATTFSKKQYADFDKAIATFISKQAPNKISELIKLLDPIFQRSLVNSPNTMATFRNQFTTFLSGNDKKTAQASIQTIFSNLNGSDLATVVNECEDILDRESQQAALNRLTAESKSIPVEQFASVIKKIVPPKLKDNFFRGNLKQLFGAITSNEDFLSLQEILDVAVNICLENYIVNQGDGTIMFEELSKKKSESELLKSVLDYIDQQSPVEGNEQVFNYLFMFARDLISKKAHKKTIAERCLSRLQSIRLDSDLSISVPDLLSLSGKEVKDVFLSKYVDVLKSKCEQNYNTTHWKRYFDVVTLFSKDLTDPQIETLSDMASAAINRNEYAASDFALSLLSEIDIDIKPFETKLEELRQDKDFEQRASSVLNKKPSSSSLHEDKA